MMNEDQPQTGPSLVVFSCIFCSKDESTIVSKHPWTFYQQRRSVAPQPPWCNVSPSPTDVSPTENSWMLLPLDKVSLG